jgi:hypothetical protein
MQLEFHGPMAVCWSPASLAATLITAGCEPMMLSQGSAHKLEHVCSAPLYEAGLPCSALENRLLPKGVSVSDKRVNVSEKGGSCWLGSSFLSFWQRDFTTASTRGGEHGRM